MSLIQTHELTKRFGTFTAIERLSIDVAPGIVGLVGANGAGKSTLLKMLLGLMPATSGTASVLGHDVRTHGMRVRELVGYMPEHDCLPPDVSATELVAHMARMSGLPRNAARERGADTLRHVGLYEERYRPIGEYSTGMRQRVKLAQALVHDPSLVLLDEPTSGLDPAGRDEMLTLVQRIGAEFGVSVLVTSHLLGELERVCDAVVVIDGGELLRYSSTADMTTATPIVVVEVDDAAEQLAALLDAAGLDVAANGRLLEVTLVDDHGFDVIRDCVAKLGVGLVRMEPRRHRMAELFSTGASQ